MLIIVRGIPGSGKSTFVKTHFPSYIHLEADMFFTNFDGDYKFDVSLLGAAHTWCINTARIFMNNKKDVVVSNTFTTIKEMKPYLEHAVDSGIDVKVFRMVKEYGSVHNVPPEAIQRMKDRFQDYDGELFIGGENGLSVSENRNSF